MLIASIVAVLFLVLGFWKNRRFFACVVSCETIITTYLSQAGDQHSILFAAIWIAVYSFSAAICSKNPFIFSAYILLIAHTLIHFAIASLYAAFQTLEFYYLAMAWYYIYWPVFVVSVGLIATGLVKNDRNGTRSANHNQRFSHHSEYFLDELDGGYARHAEKIYKRV